jgi:hypothetical protein
VCEKGSGTDSGDGAGDGLVLPSIPGLAPLSMDTDEDTLLTQKQFMPVYLRLYFEELNPFSYEDIVTHHCASRKITEIKYQVRSAFCNRSIVTAPLINQPNSPRTSAVSTVALISAYTASRTRLKKFNSTIKYSFSSCYWCFGPVPTSAFSMININKETFM